MSDSKNIHVRKMAHSTKHFGKNYLIYGFATTDKLIFITAPPPQSVVA